MLIASRGRLRSVSGLAGRTRGSPFVLHERLIACGRTAKFFARHRRRAPRFDDFRPAVEVVGVLQPFSNDERRSPLSELPHPASAKHPSSTSPHFRMPESYPTREAALRQLLRDLRTGTPAHESFRSWWGRESRGVVVGVAVVLLGWLGWQQVQLGSVNHRQCQDISVVAGDLERQLRDPDPQQQGAPPENQLRGSDPRRTRRAQRSQRTTGTPPPARTGTCRPESCGR